MKHLFTLFLLLLPFMASAQPQITQVTPLDTTVEQYEKFEVEIALTATYTNPYDYRQIAVKAVFIAPDNRQVTVDGFFKKDFLLDANGNLTANGDGFKVRFAPDQVGTWTYSVSVTDATGSHSFASQQFTCTPIPFAANHNKGFIRTNPSHYLHFDNGQQYIPIGENMAWQTGNAFLDYHNWLGELKANHGNFIRLWHAHWGLGIEWKNGWNGFEGLRKYEQSNGAYQDWLFDYCAANGIAVMLTLQHHGQVSTHVNPNWDDNPYNAANGGPCPNTWDFFTDTTAISHTQNRFRYILARWGYARSIMAWELFNEVEWTDNFSQHRQEIADWHSDMAAFLHSHDPYGHLITTSYAEDSYDPAVWMDPNIDITQTHYYINTPNIERVIAGGVREYLDAYGKPTLNGEFGLGGSTPIAQDPDGIHLHNSLWSGLFAGGMGSAMTWWWDTYVEPADLYYHFDAIARMTEKVPFLKGEMAPVTAKVSGTPGDLNITPNQGWGVVGIPLVLIGKDGTMTPASPDLGQYLYGSSWNTQFRSPPEFAVELTTPGTFTVTTGPMTSTSPKIAMWLDGTKVLEQNAAVNQTYSISVPAGIHRIMVDNTGTDWITIANYAFTGIGSKIDAYTLTSRNKDVAAGWVLNNQYNHAYLQANGMPTRAKGGLLKIEDFSPGNYFLKWYNCLYGTLRHIEPVTVTSDRILSFRIPDLAWDAIFIVDDVVIDPASVDLLAHASSLKVYPNPAHAGGEVELAFTLPTPSSVEITMLDQTGRQVAVLTEGMLTTGEQKVTIALPQTLSAGVYWVAMKGKEMTATTPLMIR